MAVDDTYVLQCGSMVLGVYIPLVSYKLEERGDDVQCSGEETCHA